MKKLLLVTIVCLIVISVLNYGCKKLGQHSEEESVKIENKHSNLPHFNKHNPANLNKDLEFREVVKLCITENILLYRDIRQKSLDVDSLRLKIAYIQNENLGESSNLSALEQIFKRPMKGYIEKQNVLHSKFDLIILKYNPISDQLLQEQFSQAIYEMRLSGGLEAMTQFTLCDDPAFIACLVRSSTEMLNCYRICRHKGSKPKTCIITCGLSGAFNLGECIAEHCF